MTEVEITVEIVSLADLDLFALRERWRTLYGSEPPTRMSRELLMRAVAYRIQENAFGGLSRATRAKLLAASAAQAASGKRMTRVRTDRSIKSGTKLLREWNGQTHEVMALADGGFAYRGSVYRSLSAVAREITGTQWSGPAFFGLHRQNSSGAPRASAGSPGNGRAKAERINVPA